jgi:hypothetical protein
MKGIPSNLKEICYKVLYLKICSNEIDQILIFFI